MRRLILLPALLFPSLHLVHAGTATAQDEMGLRTAEAYTRRAVDWFAKGEFDKAIADCSQAIRLKANHSAAYACRGGARLEKGEHDKALGDFTRAILLNPRDAYAAFTGRGMVWRRKGQYARAIADYHQAIRLNPVHGDRAYNALAWGLATFPDPKYRNGEQAIENAKRACRESEWRKANHLGTLAAAHAEAGDFAEAIRWQQRALEVATPTYDTAAAQRRLELYRTGRPYRERPAAIAASKEPRAPTAR